MERTLLRVIVGFIEQPNARKQGRRVARKPFSGERCDYRSGFF
ncbi:MAG TPA: hypothetical protein VGZ02_01675 [Candidatus Baltobacteraceae bacterium]|jgi:hypothetical protein|nr:hypothetical protein [Candidatus Baltobacteraceae bacterium]